MKTKVTLVLVSAILVLSIMACSFGDILAGDATQAPVDNPPVDLPPVSGDLEILSTSSFMDQTGYLHVVGEVVNNSDNPASNIVLDIQLTDASGASMLTDDTGAVVASLPFNTLLWTIAPGESTPFQYIFDTTNGVPANYVVSVMGYDIGTANRGQLAYENVQIIEDQYGDYILTGKLVNQSDQWVHINGLAGGVLDDAGTVLSTEWTGVYAALLAPAGDPDIRDRTPFYIYFPVPQIEATQWSIWWDADIATDVVDPNLGIQVTNSYFDEYGAAHLVGIVANNTDAAMSTLIVAGLYAEDGTVLDANYSFLPVPILPGTELPFDISYFGNVNFDQSQAALVSSFTVQIDPWSTYPPYTESVGLTGNSEAIQRNGSSWTVTGNAVNSSDKNISGATVLVAVYDSSNMLVATGYDYVYPDDEAYVPGESGAYEVYIYLDPAANTSGYTTRTWIVGDVSE